MEFDVSLQPFLTNARRNQALNTINKHLIRIEFKYEKKVNDTVYVMLKNHCNTYVFSQGQLAI